MASNISLDINTINDTFLPIQNQDQFRVQSQVPCQVQSQVLSQVLSQVQSQIHQDVVSLNNNTMVNNTSIDIQEFLSYYNLENESSTNIEESKINTNGDGNNSNNNANYDDYYYEDNNYNLEITFDQNDTKTQIKNIIGNNNNNSIKDNDKILSMFSTHNNPYESKPQEEREIRQEEEIMQEEIIQTNDNRYHSNSYDNREGYVTIENYSLDDNKVLSDMRRNMQMLNELEQKDTSLALRFYNDLIPEQQQQVNTSHI
ncbi:5234_t:CDS:2 [Diversispora eburnea]|uniref:5234_t:CDS:1 n=1 Tax=Diversispora eburnea TaxID=1213867 RepID=A0A9N9AWT9_9GLOM|nr:5234_t:CDS:2 [Diversispora eburnea]